MVLERVMIMIITATELKNGLGKYLHLVKEEDILITKNGKIIAKLVRANAKAVDQIDGLLADPTEDASRSF